MENEKTSRGIPKAKEVEPFKKVKDIEKIKQFLRGKECKRDYAFFCVGINIGLRASDLLKIKIRDVYKEDTLIDKVTIIEKKTKKNRSFSLNEKAKEAIKVYFNSLENINPEEYLFKSRKGAEPLTVSAAHKIIKTICKEQHIVVKNILKSEQI